MNNYLKTLRTMFTGIGGSLPTANPTQHGMLALKRATSTEDEAYLVLRDSSGNLQFRRLVTTTYADSTYAAGNHSHAQIIPAPASFPIGLPIVDPSTATGYSTNTTHAVYMGRADAAYTSVSINVGVETAAVTITWAEVGVGTAPQITLGSAASITRRGYTDVSASFNSTGDKTVAVTVTGISAGDHLWALFGSQATTPYQVTRAQGSDLRESVYQTAAVRISTMSSPQAFSTTTVATNIAAGYWIGS